MRISILNPCGEFYSPTVGGAIATVIMEHARRLVDRGHDVTVYTMTCDEPLYEDAGEVVRVRGGTRGSLSFVQRRISDVSRKLNGWDYPYYERYLRSCLRELASRPVPDLTIVHNDFFAPLYIKQLFPQTHTVLWLHNEWRTNARNQVSRLTAVDQFVTVSDYIKRWTSDQYQIPMQSFLTIRNGVDTRRFTPRAGWLKPTSPLRVLYVGRIDPNKGPDLAADAVAKLRQEGLAVEFTVAGSVWWYDDGRQREHPYLVELKSKIEQAGGTYLGKVVRAKIADLVREHDVVCVLSRSQDPFPLVTFEAMASGCAVLGSNRGGIPEACRDAGVLVDPDDFDSVVAAIRRFATDSDYLAQVKQRCRTRAEANDWNAVVDRIDDLLCTDAPAEEALFAHQS